MKKTIVILIIIFLAATIGLIVFHVLNSSVAGKLYDNKQIVVSQSDHSSTIYEWSEISALSEDFTAVYKRKVGPATEHTYTGVPLSELIELAGISLTEHSTVLVKSIDSYTVELSAKEVFSDDNVYIVHSMDSSFLSDEFGHYMLLIKQDEVSTRWNKMVVDIFVN